MLVFEQLLGWIASRGQPWTSTIDVLTAPSGKNEETRPANFASCHCFIANSEYFFYLFLLTRRPVNWLYHYSREMKLVSVILKIILESRNWHQRRLRLWSSICRVHVAPRNTTQDRATKKDQFSWRAMSSFHGRLCSVRGEKNQHKYMVEFKWRRFKVSTGGPNPVGHTKYWTIEDTVRL